MDELANLLCVLVVVALMVAAFLLAGTLFYLLAELGEWTLAVMGEAGRWLRGLAGR